MTKPAVCIFAPTSGGGHARYAWELATAMARHPRAVYRYELVSSRDLENQFRSTEYAVHPILPPIRQRTTFRTRAGWIADRIAHYPRRERQFLRWLRERGDIAAVHLQEW